MFNTEWCVRKASNYKWHEKRMVYTSITFAAILQDLYEEYGCQIIVDFENKTFWIYDDYME